MKKLFLTFFVCILTFSVFASADFTAIDSMLGSPEEWQAAYTELEDLLASAGSGRDNAEIYWRLSRLCVLFGDSMTEKNAKREWYAKGKNFADLAVEQDPSVYQSYLWHSANLGRDIQTRSLAEQASSVDKLMADYKMIINTLGVLDYSEAWQAMTEVYWRHPFKSNSSAVSFARAAVDTIPEGEVRTGTYQLLAQVLYDRNWSQKKRVTEIQKKQKEWNKVNSDTIEKYTNYEGRNGVDVTPVWSTKKLSELTDRQEAKIILMYAKMLYEIVPRPSSSDTEAYNAITELLAKW